MQLAPATQELRAMNVSMPAPSSVQAPQTAQAPDANRSQDVGQVGGAVGGSGGDQLIDYTLIPKELDQRFEELDEDACLRPTIISAGDSWTRLQKKSLLLEPVSTTLGPDEQKSERG